MKKKNVLLIAIIAIMMMFLCGCGDFTISGETNNNEKDEITYEILLNSGSCFVYTFKDTETGVWYISTSEGVTPRLNPDGSLYYKEK